MKLLVATMCLIVMGTVVCAQEQVNPKQAFYRGRDLFDRGDFAGAIETYKSALKVGSSRELLFNLGTACLFSGKNGEALYYLLQAQALAPRDEDIQRNIDIARARAKDEIKDSHRTKFVAALLYVHEKTTRNESFAIFAACYLLAMLFLHLRLIRPGKWFLRLAILLLMISAALGYSLVARSMSAGEVTKGVILPKQVEVFSGPSDHTYAVFFKLHEAAEVRVLEVKSGWVKIAVDDKKGYVPVNQIGLL